MNFNLDLCKTYESEIKQAVNDVIDSKKYILSEWGLKFEREFAEYTGQRFCIGVNSGTDALRIALLSLGIGPGDEVISPAFNVAYTALAVDAVGAKNVFCDVDVSNLHMDSESLYGLCTSRTKAVIPVHLFGQMCFMDEIYGWAKNGRNCLIVEDAAQAHGSKLMGYRPGDLAEATAYSFYPTKNLGSLGEAGGITTNLPIVNEQARLWRDAGREDRYSHKLRGLNSVMDELQAAVLSVKLKHLDESNKKRVDIAKRYWCELHLKVGDITCVNVPDGVYHLFVIRTKERDRLHKFLSERVPFSTPTLIHYPIPVPYQPCFMKDYGGQGPFPNTERACREVLSLPMYPDLGRFDQFIVIDAIKEFYARG